MYLVDNIVLPRTNIVHYSKAHHGNGRPQGQDSKLLRRGLWHACDFRRRRRHLGRHGERRIFKSMTGHTSRRHAATGAGYHPSPRVKIRAFSGYLHLLTDRNLMFVVVVGVREKRRNKKRANLHLAFFAYRYCTSSQFILLLTSSESSVLAYKDRLSFVLQACFCRPHPFAVMGCRSTALLGFHQALESTELSYKPPETIMVTGFDGNNEVRRSARRDGQTPLLSPPWWRLLHTVHV